MKYTITHTAEWILLAIVTVLLCYTAWKAYTIKEKVEYITITDTIQITDTITNWQSDTVYFSHYDTINTTDVVIINDTVNDTTYIQLPIYTYIYDTTITDTNYKTDLRAVLSGFQCQMDSLYLSTEIMPQRVKKQPWYSNICPSAGVGFGTGGFGFFVGIGYKIF
jgi:hypothetical protein